MYIQSPSDDVIHSIQIISFPIYIRYNYLFFYTSQWICQIGTTE